MGNFKKYIVPAIMIAIVPGAIPLFLYMLWLKRNDTKKETVDKGEKV